MKNPIDPNKDNRFERTNSIIINNDKFLVAVSGKNYDSIAAGAGLGLVLKSLGKEVELYTDTSFNKEDFQVLNGIDQFVRNLSGGEKKLEIVFNCPVDDIEKVTSDPEGDKLSLIVNFKKEANQISPADVEIKKADPVFQAGFILDVNFSNENLLTRKGNWVWLSKEKGQKSWAEVNVVEEKATLSESVIALISRGDFQIPVSAAQNFYLGIKNGTNNFEKADSIALETAAYCLRLIEKEQTQPRTEQKQTKTEIEAKESTAPEPKEGSTISEWKKPPIFTGATTPKK
jgi:hypothetical protein